MDNSKEALSTDFSFLYNLQFWFLLLSNSITSFLMTSITDWLGQYLIEVCHISNHSQLQHILFSNEVINNEFYLFVLFTCMLCRYYQSNGINDDELLFNSILLSMCVCV